MVQFDVEYDQGVVFVYECCFGVVVIELLVDLEFWVCGVDLFGQLIVGGLVVFDYGDFGYVDFDGGEGCLVLIIGEVGCGWCEFFFWVWRIFVLIVMNVILVLYCCFWVGWEEWVLEMVNE